VPSFVLASHCPGRLRLRSPRWRAKSALDALVRAVGAIEGLERLEPNPRVGSLLVFYDPVRLPPSSLLARLSPLLGEEEASPVPQRDGNHGVNDDSETEARGASRWAVPVVSRDINRAAKIGMLATTGLTVAALGFNRRVHALAGGAGLAFLAVHLLHHRRKILR